MSITKLDVQDQENKRFIAGYANIHGVVDSQDEMVTREALEEAWNKFIQSPEFALCQLMHSNIPIAKIILEEVVDGGGNTHKSGVNDKGLYIVAQVREDITIADDVWKRIESGQFRGFSIGGRNLKPQGQTCIGDRCFSAIKNLELYEVSIVDKPANKVSIFNILKRDEELNDSLLKLARITSDFTETILIEGIIKVSTTPNKDGKYEVVPCLERGTDLCKMISEYLATRKSLGEFIVVEEENPEMEYVKFFDIGLLRPLPTEDLAEKDGHVGSNPPLLKDKPQKEGETPLPKEEEVEKENIESPKSDAEPVETPIEEAEKVHEEEEEEEEPEEEEKAEAAIAPITLEAVAASLQQIADRMDSFDKRFESLEKVETIEKAEEPEKVETPVEAETPPKTESSPSSEPMEPIPVKEEPQAPIEEAPKVEPVVETPEPVVETRGVNVVEPIPKKGLDLLSIHQEVSYKDLDPYG
jgi:HK97 family phage prohead protease